MCDKFFKMGDNNKSCIIRGNSKKSYKLMLNIGSLQISIVFSIREVNYWNQLQEEVISAKSANSFQIGWTSAWE